MTQVRAISARTAQSNTPESDMEREVLHVVSYQGSDGKIRQVTIMAEDPMDAIDKVNRMSEESLNSKT